MGYSKRTFANRDINAFKREINRFISNTEKASIDGIEKALDILFATSDELVPYDTGDTFRSKWREYVRVGNKLGADFGYDREQQIPYIGLIYLGVYDSGDEIRFRNGKVARWLERAYEIEKSRINKVIETTISTAR